MDAEMIRKRTAILALETAYEGLTECPALLQIFGSLIALVQRGNFLSASSLASSVSVAIEWQQAKDEIIAILR